MRRLVLIAILAGCAALTACSSNSTSVNAPSVSLQSIAVTAANPNIVVNQSEQLTAMGNYTDNSSKDLTSSVTWTSSDSTLATVSSNGTFTAKSSGKVTITARMNSVSGSLDVTIAPALASIAITPANSQIAQQTTEQFIATGTYTDNSTQNITSSVNWNSSNPAVASIGATSPTSGLALGVSPGKVTITASSGAISATTSLTVTSAAVSTLTISPANATLALDVSKQFKATATFTDNTQQDVTGVVKWSSSSSAVASVTVSGLVTAKSLGGATISASFESASASASVTVDASNLNSISIQSSSPSIAQGTNVFFTATGTFSDGSTHNLTTLVTWSSDNTSVLNFALGGQAHGLTPGAVNVTATLGSVFATVLFNVSNATITSITVTPFNATIPIGWHKNFTATGVFSDSSSQDITAIVQWSSTSPAVATVSSSGSNLGSVAGVSAGNTNIKAQFSFAGANATGTSPLTVSSATLSSIAISPSSGLLAPGSGLQFNATGKWSDGSSQVINPFVTWSSSNNNVATVSVGGVATGQSSGNVTITAKTASLSANASLVVEGSALQSIQVTPQASSVPVGIEEQFKATGNFADGQNLDLTSAVTWTSSASAIATVSNTNFSAGLVTGIAPGSSTIAASFAGQSGNTTLTVTNATLNSIAITPANPSISLGSTQQFTAKGTFSDSSVINLTNQVAWSSSDPSVATINTSGVASSASAGTTTIRASLNQVNGNTTLTVH